jgi:hypothetical protein
VKVINLLYQVKDIKDATICKVIPEKFSGSKEIVPLYHKNTVSSNLSLGI